MATAYKCDICGKLMETSATAICNIIIGGKKIQAAILPVDNLNHPTADDVSVADWCDICLVKIKEALQIKGGN